VCQLKAALWNKGGAVVEAAEGEQGFRNERASREDKQP